MVSLSFLVLKAPPRALGPQGLTFAYDSLLSRSLLILGPALMLLGIISYTQDCVLRLQMSERLTVVCGKTSHGNTAFFSLRSPSTVTRGDRFPCHS